MRQRHALVVGLLLFSLISTTSAAPPDAERVKPKRRFVNPIGDFIPAPERTTHFVEMRDGAKLATDVFLPEEGDGPWPVFFLRGPYGKNGYGSLLAGGICKQGYVFISQDMRGRYDSPGNDSPVFINDGIGEKRDGHDSLAWIAAQPWCNGQIVTFGSSALGITQTLMAPAAPEALAAQHVYWGLSNYYTQAIFQGGAFRKSLVEGWLASIEADPETLESYTAHAVYGPYWDGVNPGAHAHAINAPAFCWGGWFDIFSQGTIDYFAAAHNRGGPRARGRCHLVMGPWAHGQLIEVSYPENALAPAHLIRGKRTPGEISMTNALAFFEHHLKGIDNGVDRDPAVHYYVMGDADDPNAPGNFWRAADNWPPPANHADYYFHSNGKLRTSAPSRDDGRLTYRYDPSDPVPTIGGANMIIDRGPMDQRRIESRADVLVFTSDVLTKPLEVTGHIFAKLYVSSDCPDTDFTVKLCDVYPDGRSMIMNDGIIRARFREGFEKEVFTRPDEIYEVTVDLWSMSLILNEGHRIRVSVSSSNAPRFDPNPNTGKPFRADDKTRIATNTLHVSAEHPSRIILPISTGE